MQELPANMQDQDATRKNCLCTGHGVGSVRTACVCGTRTVVRQRMLFENCLRICRTAGSLLGLPAYAGPFTVTLGIAHVIGTSRSPTRSVHKRGTREAVTLRLAHVIGTSPTCPRNCSQMWDLESVTLRSAQVTGTDVLLVQDLLGKVVCNCQRGRDGVQFSHCGGEKLLPHL